MDVVKQIRALGILYHFALAVVFSDIYLLIIYNRNIEKSMDLLYLLKLSEYFTDVPQKYYNDFITKAVTQNLYTGDPDFKLASVAVFRIRLIT